MSWWDEDEHEETNFWMFKHGFEPRAGRGLWMREAEGRSFSMQAPMDQFHRRWEFRYRRSSTCTDGSVIRLELEADHYAAFEPFLSLLCT